MNLFTLRGVDPGELVTTESVDWLTLRVPSKRVLDGASLSGIFGVDIVKESGPRYGAKKRKARPKARKKQKAKRPRSG